MFIESEKQFSGGNFEQLKGGVITEQRLLMWFFENLKGTYVSPITTDQFLKKSSEQYGIPWLCRELVQNFIDHNQDHPGTLNGVDLVEEELKNGGSRFTIKGGWPFKDPTGVISPHSEKSEDRNSAGGNGIGLKQVAILLLRDLDVTRFDVNGENWRVEYGLALADDFNRELKEECGKRKQVPITSLRHNWLVGDMIETDNKGLNSYVIETTNDKLIRSLRELKEIGVCSENPYLQNPDFESEKGIIKWLPYDSSNHKNEKGRLFINGQVMGYKEDGPDKNWNGMEGVSLALHNIPYKISIDRPPVSPINLASYLSELILSMDFDDLVDQLGKSEHLWSGLSDNNFGFFSDKPGFLVVIDTILNSLPYKKNSRRPEVDFYKIFPSKSNHIAYVKSITKPQAEELEKNGYVLCYESFTKIGMKSAELFLEDSDKNVLKRPSPYTSQRALEKLSTESGVNVGFDDINLSEKYNAKVFFEEVFKNLALDPGQIEEREGRKNTFRIHFKNIEPFTDKLLAHSLAMVPKNDQQKLLRKIRGIIFHGITNNIFENKDVFLFSGRYLNTFDTSIDDIQGGVLCARLVETSNSGGTFIEFTVNDAIANIVRGLIGNMDQILQKANNAVVDETNETAEMADAYDKVQGTMEGESQGENLHGHPDDSIEGYINVLKGHGLIPSYSSSKKPISPEEEARSKRLSEIDIEFVGPTGENESDQRIIYKEMMKKVSGDGNMDEKTLDELIDVAMELDRLRLDNGENGKENSGNNKILDKYLAWRENPETFYGDSIQGSSYLTGKHLLDIFTLDNQANIAVVEEIPFKTDNKDPIKEKQKTLNSLLKRIARETSSGHKVEDDFDLIVNPEKSYLAQLTLLKTYVQVLISVDIPNDLFIYEGTGSKGLNIAKKAIGLHKELFHVSLSEAFSVFVHEIAHNVQPPSDEDAHGNTFRAIMQALFAVGMKNLQNIVERLGSGGKLTKEEWVVSDVQQRWNDLVAFRKNKK